MTTAKTISRSAQGSGRPQSFRTPVVSQFEICGDVYVV
jgi:hypothetical protein